MNAMESSHMSRCAQRTQHRPTHLKSNFVFPPRARCTARVAYTPGEVTPVHDAPRTAAAPTTVVLDVSPQPPSSPLEWQEEQPVNLQRLQEEYQRGYEAGLQAAREQPQQKELVQDSVQRTAAKALTWRVLSTATTIGLAIVLFKDSVSTDAALELGVVEFLSKYGLYFVHERAWALVTFLV